MSEASTASRPVRTTDVVRRRNLARVLRLVHERGPMPRSALTRETGLNRSTVAALVGELVDLGLVVEGDAPPATGVGRPSATVSASAQVVALGIVPEIDAVTLAVIGLDGTEHERRTVRTTSVSTPGEALAIATDLVAAATDQQRDAGRRVVGIAVSVPGIVRVGDGVVRYAPHLAWRDEAFAAPLADRTGLPVRAANDANLGVTAEFLYGAGRGATDVVYVNGGASGIGGGIITGGRPLAGAAGYAGELGHTFVAANGIRCHCGAVGCLETEASQAALLDAAGLGIDEADRLGDVLADGPTPALAAVVDRQVTALAVAIRNVVHTVNPDVVVLGGFLGTLLRHVGTRLEDAVRAQTMTAMGEDLRIVPAELVGSVLFRGAAELAFASVLADPTAG